MCYKKIGKITQTLGLEGKVILSSESTMAKPLQQLEHLFIELQKGHFIPFFPKERPALLDTQTLSWQLDEVYSPEDARPLLGKDVYIESDLYKKLFPANSSLEEDLSDFQIIDIHSGNTGKIQSVETLPGQLLANVIFEKKTCLLPLQKILSS